MYGSYESSQYVEVISGDDGKETEFQITVTCVTRGDPGRLSGPPEDCYGAEAAEFELDSVHVIGDDGNPLEISMETLRAFVGKELAQKMHDSAVTEAIESGDF